MTDTEALERGHYMVRAMDQSDAHYRAFFEGDAVAVGWSRVDLGGAGDVEAAVAAVTRVYLEPNGTDPRVAGRKKNEVRRFLLMEPGDRVVVPVPYGVRLAEVTGPPLHVPEAAGDDLANQRPARYLQGPDGAPLTVARDRLTEGLQRRLRVRGASVLDLSEFADEVDRLFEGGDVGSDDRASEVARAEAFKADLLARLRDGSTLLAAGGAGLERLVQALLEADGYTAEVLPKTTFDGFADADVKASRSDRFADVQLLVQVKHHSGKTGAWGAEQLLEVRRRHPDVWDEYRLVLVTSAEAADTLAKVCEDQGVVLIDGDALADWVLDAVADLPADLLRQLRISNVPSLL